MRSGTGCEPTRSEKAADFLEIESLRYHLHELAHLMDVIQPDRNRQRQVDQNDKILEKNCKKLIKALGKR